LLTVCVLVSFQERATGGAARVLPRGTLGAAEVMKFCAAAACETDSVSRSAGRFATIPVTRHCYGAQKGVQNSYPLSPFDGNMVGLA
jgi:hypothetical protein